MSETDWTPKVGERVAVMRVAYPGPRRDVTFETVDRIGKRDIVLSDGSRFRVRDLEQPNNGSVWNATTVRLVDPDSEVVAEVQQEQALRRRRNYAAAVADDYRRGDAQAAEVVLAFAPLTGVGDEIRALFTDEAAR